MLKESGNEVPKVTNTVLWQELYTSAMLELDRACLHGKILAAQEAIQNAMKESGNGGAAGATEERQAMADALRNLQTLQQLELRLSTPASGPSQSLAEG